MKTELNKFNIKDDLFSPSSLRGADFFTNAKNEDYRVAMRSCLYKLAKESPQKATTLQDLLIKYFSVNPEKHYLLSDKERCCILGTITLMPEKDRADILKQAQDLSEGRLNHEILGALCLVTYRLLALGNFDSPLKALAELKTFDDPTFT